MSTPSRHESVQVVATSLADGSFSPAARLWGELFANSPQAGPYVSPTWTATWVRLFGKQLAPLLLAVVDREHRQIGACLLTAQRRYATILPHVRWHINTDGEAHTDSVVIEHNQLLAYAGREAEVAGALARHAQRSRVDELRISGLREESVEEIREAFAGWGWDAEWNDAPYVQLDALRSAQRDYLSVLSSNTRSQVRRSLSRYRRRGELQLQSAATADEAEHMLDELIVLHQARWVAKGSRGGFASAIRREFHRAFIRLAVPGGEAQLLRVTAGGETVGILYNLVGHRKVNFYQSGFLYEADRELRPGMVAHYLAIEHNLSLGMAEYDFLASAPGEGRYKLSLSTNVRRLAWLTLYRPGWRTHYFGAIRKIRGRLSRSVAPDNDAGSVVRPQYARVMTPSLLPQP